MTSTANPGLPSCRKSHCAYVHPVITTKGKSQPSLRQLLECLCWGTEDVGAKGSPTTAFCSCSCYVAHRAALLLLHHHSAVSEEPRAAPCWGGCVNPCLAAFCTCSLTCERGFFHLKQDWNWFMKMAHIKIWRLASASCCSPQSREKSQSKRNAVYWELSFTTAHRVTVYPSAWLFPEMTKWTFLFFSLS